jgi:hypothetical protein
MQRIRGKKGKEVWKRQTDGRKCSKKDTLVGDLAASKSKESERSVWLSVGWYGWMYVGVTRSIMVGWTRREGGEFLWFRLDAVCWQHVCMPLK